MRHADNIPVRDALAKRLSAAIAEGKQNTSREKMIVPKQVSVLVSHRPEYAYYRSYLTPTRTTFPFTREGLAAATTAGDSA